MATITYTEKLTTVTCTCGINFAIPETLNEQALDKRGPNGKSIVCPLGHRWHYTGKTDAELEREKRELAERRAAATLAQLDQERASHASTKGQLTKVRKRTANGVCPCCNRSFVQLTRHMKTRHPDFDPES